MRQADPKFIDMSPRGREVFRQAVECGRAVIGRGAYCFPHMLERRDDFGGPR